MAQVILNRVRDPNFPASVCGVVYQGAERVTGCQFSFTCDGSLARPPVAWAWNQAESVARLRRLIPIRTKDGPVEVLHHCCGV